MELGVFLIGVQAARPDQHMMLINKHLAIAPCRRVVVVKTMLLIYWDLVHRHPYA
jgi:hypothetical protein